MVRTTPGDGPYVCGLEKSGSMVDFARQLARHDVLAPGDLLICDDEIVARVTNAANAKAYGKETYWGRKFIYRALDGRVIVPTVMPPTGAPYDATGGQPDPRAYPTLPAILDVIDRVAYLDPPYLSKSGKLYRRSFDKTSRSEAGVDLDWTAPLQHYQLARFLRTEMQFRWVLSYDFDPLLLEDEGLYASKAMHPSVEAREMLGVRSWRISKRKVTLNYTASSRTGRGAAAELLLTTLPPSTVPDNHRLSGIS